MLPTDKNILESFKEGLTQSEIMERCNCPRKHMFRYILQLKRQGSFSWALLTGGAVHTLLEEHYKLLQEGSEGLLVPKAVEFDFEPDIILDPTQHEEYKYWQFVSGLLVHRHNLFYQERDSNLKIHNVEHSADVEYRGLRLRGKIDLVASGEGKPRFWIMDHKTTSDINDLKLEGWQFRFQFLFYSWLWKQIIERPSGTFVNMLKKPRQMRMRMESIEAFINRINTDMLAEPLKYFRREWIPLDDDILDRFQRYTLDPVITKFLIIQEMATDNEFDRRFTDLEKQSMLLEANTDHCISWNVKCEFLNLCKDNFQDYAVEFIRRHIKHPELGPRPTAPGLET